MTDFKRKGENKKYNFRAKECIGLKCWAPGLYQHRSPLAGGGSMNTSSPDTPCCMNRAYHGCPRLIPAFQDDLANSRKKEGWKPA